MLLNWIDGYVTEEDTFIICVVAGVMYKSRYTSKKLFVLLYEIDPYGMKILLELLVDQFIENLEISSMTNWCVVSTVKLLNEMLLP